MTEEIIRFLMEQLGPFFLGVLVMYLWLRSVQAQLAQEQRENVELRKDYKDLQDARVGEMQEQLGLLKQFKLLVDATRKSL